MEPYVLEEGPSVTDPSSPRVLTILGSILEGLVARHERLVETGGWLGSGFGSTNIKVFHGVRAPNISIEKYLERLYKYVDCSPSCFVVGYVYIDRLLHKYPEMLVNSLNVHRLLVTSVMVASKILDDVQYNNAFYAKIGGVSNVELNKLELELLFLLDFRVSVSSPVFESYCSHFEKETMRHNLANTIEKAPLALCIDDHNNTNGISVEEVEQEKRMEIQNLI